MEYERSDHSGGMDNDLPPHQIFGGPRSIRNEKERNGAHFAHVNSEQMLYRLEHHAYVAVLQAFMAQREVLTWAKEQIMSSLRKELNISHDQHMEFVSNIKPYGLFRQYRDEQVSSMFPPNFKLIPDSAVGDSRKRQKNAHGLQSLPLASLDPSLSGQWLQPGRGKDKKSKGARQLEMSAAPTVNMYSVCPHTIENSARGVDFTIGRRVKIRWPGDRTFYEAVITKYDSSRGLYAVVYDFNTENPTQEWVNFEELPPEDLIIMDAPLASVALIESTVLGNFAEGQVQPGRGIKTGVCGNPSRELKKLIEKPNIPPQDCKDSRAERYPNLRALEWNSLKVLIKEVDKIAEENDLSKIQSIKSRAQQHEELLRKALSEVGESSDEGGSDEQRGRPFLRSHSMDHERDRRSRRYGKGQHVDHDEDDTAGDRGEGTAGEHSVSDSE